MRQRLPLGWRACQQVIEHVEFGWRQSQACWGIWGRPIEHRHPEYAPAHDAEDGDQISKALSGPKPRIFSSASGLQDLVENLDVPSHGVPFKLFDGSASGVHRQIGDQLPANFLSVPWCCRLLGVE